MDVRAQFNKDVELLQQPLKVGDRVLSDGELCVADFHLAEVRPLQLDAVALGGRRTRGSAVRKLQGVGNSTSFVLSVENDNDFRSRCE